MTSAAGAAIRSFVVVVNLHFLFFLFLLTSMVGSLSLMCLWKLWCIYFRIIWSIECSKEQHLFVLINLMHPFRKVFFILKNVIDLKLLNGSVHWLHFRSLWIKASFYEKAKHLSWKRTLWGYKAFLTWHARQGWAMCSSTEHDSLL